MNQIDDNRGEGALQQAARATAAEPVSMPDAETDADIWAYASSVGKSLLGVAPRDFRLTSTGGPLMVNFTLNTREEMRAVREIIRHVGQALLPSAQGMETRQGGDGTAPSQDDSPVAESHAPDCNIHYGNLCNCRHQGGHNEGTH